MNIEAYERRFVKLLEHFYLEPLFCQSTDPKEFDRGVYKCNDQKILLFEKIALNNLWDLWNILFPTSRSSGCVFAIGLLFDIQYFIVIIN